MVARGTMGAGPDDRFASGQSVDADVEKTADQRAEDSNNKIKGPLMLTRLGSRLRLRTPWSLCLPNEMN